MNKVYDKEAEQSVLGALLLDNSISFKVREISEDIFFINTHKEIYKAMRYLVENNQPIDILLLKSELEKTTKEISLSYITSLTTIVATTGNIDHYIKILHKFKLMRELRKQAETIIRSIDGNADISEIAADIDEMRNITIRNSSISGRYIDASDIEPNYEKHKNISSGFSKLDSVMDGFRYGTLTVLSGKPSSGKSTIINQFIASAIDSGHKRFLYSGELPASTVMDWFRRMVVSECDIKKYTTEYGMKFNDASERATQLIRNWIKEKLFIYSEDAVEDESSMLSTIEHLWLKKGVRLFVIDNLMTINISGQDKYESQKIFVRNIKNIAKKYNLVVILVAHPKKTKDDKFDMFDVAGASEIVNLCDYELATHRKIDEDKQTDETFLLVLKNRATGKQNLSLRLYFSDERKRLYSTQSELERVYKYDIDKLYTQGSLEDIAPF